MAKDDEFDYSSAMYWRKRPDGRWEKREHRYVRLDGTLEDVLRRLKEAAKGLRDVEVDVTASSGEYPNIESYAVGYRLATTEEKAEIRRQIEAKQRSTRMIEEQQVAYLRKTRPELF